ncbi:MAG: winged helix-turn-helix transcriptional regulator [Exiguobacterium profundum]|nr:MAG: winged helix-turn-helix transcriptional regulator [Exiguobacterium profundum]
MPLDRIFMALGDPTRLAIVTRLLEGEATVAELCAPFGLRQPTISRHLRVLEEAGLIASGREATRRPRRLRPEAIAAISDWVEPFRRAWEGRFDRLEALAATDPDHRKAAP